MPYTKEQKREKRRERRQEDPEATSLMYWKQNIKHSFGISPKQYQQMFDEQKGLCAICERHQKNFKRRLAIDHDHHTGKIRGLLCASCNSGLGKLQDSVDYLESAIIYLQRNGPRFLTHVERTPDVKEVL